MTRHVVWGAVMAAMLAVPVGGSAQTPTWKDVQVADIETMRDKFIQLGEAFDESQYDWRPMDGVRSVREVLGLAVAEAHMFPTGWGFEAPSAAAGGFGPKLARAVALAKAAMLSELADSFEFLIGVVRDMSEGDRTTNGSFFGQAMPTHASSATAMADMHEHLGQLIAYARTNEVVATGGGLVFGGDVNGRFRAFDHETGEVLWEISLGSAVSGFPISYAVDGQQFVAVSTGTPRFLDLTPELRPSSGNNLFVCALPE